MRLLLCLSVIVLFLSSCQLHEAHIITSNPQPFLQLKNGTVIHTHKVEWGYQAFQKEFVVNKQVIPASDVAFYSDGINSFANVGGRNFAEMISEGKINVYKTQHFTKLAGKKTGYGAGPYLRHNSMLDHYYIQNMQRTHNRTVVKLNYKNLEKIIPEDAVAYNYVLQYKHQRNLSTITAGIGVAAIIGGVAMSGTKFGKKNPVLGSGLEAGGAGITAVSVAFKIPYKVRLFRILNFYN